MLVVLALVGAGCISNPNRGIQLLGGAGPVYPAAALERGIEGAVTVSYDVTVDGEVANARVVASDPAGVFDDAALAAVRSWRFNPRLVDGEPAPALARVSTVEFKLGESDEYDGY